jgi:signal transduction histidine kinase
MPFPRPKTSSAPGSRSVPKSLCRLQRRKLARRPKPSSQSLAPSTSNSGADQIVDIQSELRRRRPSALLLNEQSVEQSFGSEAFLQAIVEACASNVAVIDEFGKVLYVSKPWRLAVEKYDHRGSSHPLNLNCLKRRNGSNAGHSNQTSALTEDIQAILDGRLTEFQNEYSCRSLSGTSWFEVHAARLDLPGTTGAFRVLVNSSNITRAHQTEEILRDLGGRLITAQEEERTRVARELHDDLNQRMALLSVELEQISQKLPPSQGALRLSINKVWDRAQEISSEIHRVAYQLHPSKLDHLGLVAAVKSHCLELAAHHELKIAFKETGCDGLTPKDVTLCLFRIVQESFRNVIKHSGASEASVVLVGIPGFIQLSISDNGRGFDLDSIGSKNGLGLISMRERLRLVGGTISIQSSARGTRTDVSVPVGGSDIARGSRPIVKECVVPSITPSLAVGLFAPMTSGHEMRKDHST